MPASAWATMKSSAPRGVCAPASAPSPSRCMPSVRLHVQTGVGEEAGKPRLTSRSTLPTRCSSADRMYVSGRPDSKISRIVLAARLSTGPGVADGSITGLLIVFSSAILRDSFIMDERPGELDDDDGCSSGFGKV